MIPPTKEQAAVLTAAVRWWLTQRPPAWGEAEHLMEPTVNTYTSDGSRELATAVAELVRADPFGYGAGRKRAKKRSGE